MKQADPIRVPLPDRRRCLNFKVEHGPLKFFLTIGYYDDGRAGDVFASGAKEGSDVQALTSDACCIISIALQCGISPEELDHSLAKVPVWTADGMIDGPGSLLGTIVETIIANADYETAALRETG